MEITFLNSNIYLAERFSCSYFQHVPLYYNYCTKVSILLRLPFSLCQGVFSVQFFCITHQLRVSFFDFLLSVCMHVSPPTLPYIVQSCAAFHLFHVGLSFSLLPQTEHVWTIIKKSNRNLY